MKTTQIDLSDAELEEIVIALVTRIKLLKEFSEKYPKAEDLKNQLALNQYTLDQLISCHNNFLR